MTSMKAIDFTIRQVSWQEMEPHLRSIRSRVFIEEQQVPVELEWDDEDKQCIHLLVEVEGQYVATARLLGSGQIGRMAVLEKYRNKGIGSAMLTYLLKLAQETELNKVFLNSQTDAVDFYKRFGFTEQGELFNDAGIMHRRMNKDLQQT